VYISVGDVDSTRKVSDVTRIRMFDGSGAATPLTYATTGTIVNVDDYAFESQPRKTTNNPGYESSLYAKASGAVKKIILDQSSLAFKNFMIGRKSRRGVFPALDFVYCAETMPPTEAPVTQVTDPIADEPAPTIPPIPLLLPDARQRPTGGVNGDVSPRGHLLQRAYVQFLFGCFCLDDSLFVYISHFNCLSHCHHLHTMYWNIIQTAYDYGSRRTVVQIRRSQWCVVQLCFCPFFPMVSKKNKYIY